VTSTTTTPSYIPTALEQSDTGEVIMWAGQVSSIDMLIFLYSDTQKLIHSWQMNYYY